MGGRGKEWGANRIVVVAVVDQCPHRAIISMIYFQSVCSSDYSVSISFKNLKISFSVVLNDADLNA